jgi:hypothetical protein
MEMHLTITPKEKASLGCQGDGWMNGWMGFFNNFFNKTHTSGYFIHKICKKNPKVITINNVRSILKKSVAFLPT